MSGARRKSGWPGMLYDLRRTTLTLDGDLAERIAAIARETGKPIQAVLNDALRRGLGVSAPAEPEFLSRPHPGYLRPGIDDRRFNDLAWEVPATKQ
jgi:hypothetical protein